MNSSFRALLVTEHNGRFVPAIEQLNLEQLPAHDLLVQVRYSSLNFKDVLSAAGNKGVTRRFPHVPGIDAAGVVVRSAAPELPVGTPVLVTGFDLGMNTWGGFGEYISVPAAWALPLPAGLSLQEAMVFGTAGLTAGLSVQQLVRAGITPAQGEVVVSGATGGVGSLATAILAKLGFAVAAVSGKDAPDFLLGTLRASRVLDREAFVATYDAKPLVAPAFAGGVDTVGGAILSGMLKATHYGGTVTCCGMVGSAELHTSVFPFILRGVHLAGIDSVEAPRELRRAVWEQLATVWKPDNLAELGQEITLDELPAKLQTLQLGQAQGRYVLVHQH
ncbi:MAG TPA: YhdH/YhfP family quinone oxidoreductase [Hymenobacter sp.]|jgi:putative YhdH/YhfP family quinone oxidoreductase